VGRQDQKQFVLIADGSVYLLMHLSSGAHIFRGKVARNILGLQIGIEAFRELHIFGRVADKAGVKLNRLHGRDQNPYLGYERLRNTSSPKKNFGDFAVGAIDRVNANRRRPAMFTRFQALGLAQINVAEVRISKHGNHTREGASKTPSPRQPLQESHRLPAKQTFARLPHDREA
jgi:hypothetical protein